MNLDATSKSCIDSVIALIGEQHRERIMSVYRLGYIDGWQDALTMTPAQLREKLQVPA